MLLINSILYMCHVQVSVKLCTLMPTVGFCTHDVKVIVAKFYEKRADEDEKEHNQSPLAARCMHVETLGHEREVKNQAESDAARQQETQHACLEPFIPQVNSEGKIRLNPAEKCPQSKGQGGA